jgi:hypothetical protein
MQQIGASDDAEVCKQVLASVALVYRPITLVELVVLTESLDVADEAEVQEVIGLCGSFLTLRGDTIYFIHQSAQDFLLMKASDKILPDGEEATHSAIFSRLASASKLKPVSKLASASKLRPTTLAGNTPLQPQNSSEGSSHVIVPYRLGTHRLGLHLRALQYLVRGKDKVIKSVLLRYLFSP